ncbi:ORF R U12 [Macacine gammaherpesvirus 5]|uniref:ORFRU12-L n=1 Tax=Rhesus monkey rhadinovirus H26-95 TaxID=69256 RepID=Q9J2H5_9GAMA|nr:ORFRU12-L [Rhesus monkey rhadinovirus H26-95]QFN51688.1 ORF R U12 [Macacine gammaherpesvirus 5]QFN51779.1 ORF R U12 [Macacine gammaherpesvirus 5]QFN51871.1 ORF R U12 [Macacine gammaherpesvirus 5]
MFRWSPRVHIGRSLAPGSSGGQRIMLPPVPIAPMVRMRAAGSRRGHAGPGAGVRRRWHRASDVYGRNPLSQGD